MNLNETVKVKLTDYGKDIYYHQYDELNKALANRGKTPIIPHFPKVDKDGYTEFQLWCFIELYGNYIGIGHKNVIDDLNFYIEDGNLRDVKL